MIKYIEKKDHIITARGMSTFLNIPFLPLFTPFYPYFKRNTPILREIPLFYPIYTLDTPILREIPLFYPKYTYFTPI